jgi:DNA-binding NtrC family response regulator
MKSILRVGRKGKRNGQAAEAEVSQLESRVALLGIRLGPEDAIGFARELKEIRPDTLCVTITAYAELETAI